MQEGRLNIKQQTFPIEWFEIIPILDKSQERITIHSTSDSQSFKIKRKQFEDGRKPISVRRCVKCSKLDFYAA